MAKGKKESAALLKWRKKQKRGAIMKPKTFKDIERKALAEGKGEASAKKIAGAAYWRTAENKFRVKGHLKKSRGMPE